MTQQINLLSPDEQKTRLGKLRDEIKRAGADAILISDNANKYYTTGRVFAGFVYIPAEGMPIYFVRRPVKLEGDGIVYIRKPEEIPASLSLNVPATIGLELGTLGYNAAMRLFKIFPGSKTIDATPMLQAARAIKTPVEIERIAESGIKQERVYRRVPHLYREGMTDLELQIEIERTSRLEGCLGQFRISGDSMELYMGNVLTGENADNPTPYDFAMGGAGIDPSLPVGADGSIIRPTDSVMVDVNGNYTGYMTDMTRTFTPEKISDNAMHAHKCSIEICHTLQKMMCPGIEAKVLYEKAEEMAKEAGLHPYFMGHRQKAGFIGHGVGIEINERPVIAPRSRDILAARNVIALEPKFVIPGTGAVGIENTYVVMADGPARCLTNAPEEIISFE